MTQIILINGPARSGKDTVGEMVANLVGNVHITKFAHALKCATHALFLGMHDEWAKLDPTTLSDNGRACNEDYHYEGRKGEPLPRFFGLTPRQAYIAVSEIFCKPVFGQSFFGDVLAANLEQIQKDLVVITDSGFTPEAESLVDKYGAENVFVIRLSRPGYSFDPAADPASWNARLARGIEAQIPANNALLKQITDSRGYIDLPECQTFPIRNDNTKQALEYAVVLALESFSIRP